MIEMASIPIPYPTNPSPPTMIHHPSVSDVSSGNLNWMNGTANSSMEANWSSPNTRRAELIDHDWFTGFDATSDSGDHRDHIEDPTFNWPVLFLFSIVIMAIGGNVLVCLAVRCETKLRNMFNYFLVSLALSDMFSAILVMPLSIVKALIDSLPMPKLLCVTWYSLDVFFTSSTICHLCMISVDRFMALKYPLRYGHSKKKRHTIAKIAVVWVLSFCIAGPLFILSMLDNDDTVHYKGCGPETRTFVVTATVVSFYLPLVIMTIMYGMTVHALRAQLKEHRRMTVTQSPLQHHHHQLHQLNQLGASTESTCTTTHQHQTCSSSRSDTGESQKSFPFTDLNSNPNRSTTTTSTSTNTPLPISSVSGRCLSDVGRQRMQVFKFQRNGRPSGGGVDSPVGTGFWRGTIVKQPDRGRRAVRVLGYLFAVFVIFYLPFFAVYVINSTCAPCQPYISAPMITAFEWLQYSGSMLNPIVYHIFNPDFRRAFHRILRCRSTAS